MAAIMNKSANPDILPSPRDKTSGSTHEDGGSRDFEFKPHLNSSSQSTVWILSLSDYLVSCNSSFVYTVFESLKKFP
jgi:hypothetical protein